MPMKTHFFSEEDLHLFDFSQTFSNSCVWLEQGMADYEATFDLYVRKSPHRNYFVFSGLEEILEGIAAWRYSEDEIGFLLENGVITEKFANYLKNLKFSGNVWAMPDGTIFFPEEPVIRVTAPIIEANLLTFFIVQAFVSNTLFLTKALRITTAASPIPVAGISGMRAHGFESAMKAARASYIAGTYPISFPAFYRKYKIKMPRNPAMIAYHATIKSFKTEEEAFRKVNELFPNRMAVMIDTYDIGQGIKNAIKIAKELKEQGKSLLGVVIDSGDLVESAKYVKQELNESGLPEVKIVLASNLDEYKIKKLEAEGIKADVLMVNTEGATSSDAPVLEAVYKLAEVRRENEIIPVAKFATGKISYPGRKQVFRTNDFVRDIIGLEEENLGNPLLIQVIEKGKIIYANFSLDEIKKYVFRQIEKMPVELLNIAKKYRYRVNISAGLKKLANNVKKKHMVAHSNF